MKLLHSPLHIYIYSHHRDDKLLFCLGCQNHCQNWIMLSRIYGYCSTSGWWTAQPSSLGLYFFKTTIGQWLKKSTLQSCCFRFGFPIAFSFDRISTFNFQLMDICLSPNQNNDYKPWCTVRLRVFFPVPLGPKRCTSFVDSTVSVLSFIPPGK